VVKKQILVAGLGIVLVIVLFIFGGTVVPKKQSANQPEKTELFDIQSNINKSKVKLTPSQTIFLSQLENGITRGDVKDQQIKAYESLASFWEDSVHNHNAYIYYISKAAKLENSEKKLNFAARLYLEDLKREHDPARLAWKTDEAILLFEKALVLNPDDDDLKIGLGSSYIYGKGPSGDPQQTMAGIQQLLSVVRKDSNNMKAQFVLAVGGAVSGQYEKAIERFKKVIAAEPNNVEAVAFLADTYAADGQKEEAIKWYNISKKLVNNPAYSKEVDAHIQSLK